MENYKRIDFHWAVLLANGLYNDDRKSRKFDYSKLQEQPFIGVSDAD